METTDAFASLRCMACDGQFDAENAGRCPDCSGPLAPRYDDLASAHEMVFDDATAGSDLGRFAPVLPFSRESLVTAGEASTPLIDAPTLADDLGVGETAAREHGADAVALPTTGSGGQAAAAYASRAGLESHSFVPSRTTFANKAMINVHGGDMNVVGGRYPDARGAFEDAVAGESWHSLAPFAEPYRHEGSKTVAYELVEVLDAAPDAVVVPTGQGISLVGIDRGFRELRATGWIDDRPRLYAAQAAGCDPVAAAWQAGADAVDPVERPDAICGPLEIPDPAGGAAVLDAITATDGGAVATPDEEILEGAVTLAGAGIPVSGTGGAAVSGARALADEGAFAGGETVVLLDPATANREADILRSHLMKQGI
ncbi:MAG: threonine synthase [Halobacteriales archaeon SW_8_66_22]|nr:MAG: threonine synthase [Halobacteriales archaeon SW_8_66_22]